MPEASQPSVIPELELFTGRDQANSIRDQNPYTSYLENASLMVDPTGRAAV